MQKQGIITAGDINAETKLYRYTSLSHLVFMLESGVTYLTQVKKWQDRWEVPVTKFSDSDISSEMYGQCWSLNGASDALWRIYSSNKEGLLIQTKVDNFSLLCDIKYAMLAPVIYYKNLSHGLLDLQKKTDYHPLLGQAFLKRSAFEHEQEVRLITLNNKDCLKKRYPETSQIYLKINPIDFIENIIIDPRSSSWYVETVIKYCKRVGFKFTPIKSDLYAGNVFQDVLLDN